MLSYRHAYHAGNFADVLKHIVLVEILEYMVQKDKGLHYIETHAGAGLYDLTDERAGKLQEYQTGIGRLNRLDWPELDRYFEILARYNETPALRWYPGSPLIASAILRKQDRLWLHELHRDEADRLQDNVRGRRSIRIFRTDGLTGLLSLLPPVSRRGLVLVDPSYEIKTDYQQVVRALAQAHDRFPSGTYLLWYPVVERARIDRLLNDLASTGIPHIQRFELSVRADSSEPGMTGSGMIVVNPPWTLMARLTPLLKRLVPVLAQSDVAGYRADVLATQ